MLMKVKSHHTAALPDDVHTVVPTIHIKPSAGFVTLSFLTHEDQGWSKRLNQVTSTSSCDIFG